MSLFVAYGGGRWGTLHWEESRWLGEASALNLYRPRLAQVLEHWLGMAGAIKMKAKEVARFRERYADGARDKPFSDNDDSGASEDDDN